MRGYSIMSDEERQNIISQHKSFYNGYAVGNVPSNMTPLTVYDAAQDKGGVNVNNRGEVSQYANHQINEAKVEKDLVDEIEADDMDVSDVQSAYDFDSKGPEQFDHSYSDDSYDLDLNAIMQMFGGLGDSDDMGELESDMDNEFDGHEMMRGERRAYNFNSDGGNVDVYGESKMSEKERAWEKFKELNPSINSHTEKGAYVHFLKLWNKTNSDSGDVEVHSESIIRESDESLMDLVKRIMLSRKFDRIANEMEPMDFSDEFEFADNFISYLLDDYIDEEYYDDLYDLVKDEYGEIILSMYGRSDDFGDDDDFMFMEGEGVMCEQCGLSESMCECGMYEEIDEDLHEAFKTQRDTILENFNRFKKFN